MNDEEKTKPIRRNSCCNICGEDLGIYEWDRWNRVCNDPKCEREMRDELREAEQREIDEVHERYRGY